MEPEVQIATVERKLADFAGEVEARLGSISRRVKTLEEKSTSSSSLFDTDDPGQLLSKLFAIGVFLSIGVFLLYVAREVIRHGLPVPKA